MEGVCLDDRFDVERQVGEGAMGIVYRARDRLTGEAVAIKVLQRAAGSDERRFDREARILSQLGHPAVVRYVSHGKSQGRSYLAMEWLEGETLEARLARGALGIVECLALGARVAEALAEAHRKGVVHRDLKPANLFLVGGRVADTKVLDFGIARWRFDARALTRTGRTIGTLLYMSPEQARGHEDLDSRSDIFSLGAVLHECLTHRPVFRGQDALAVLAQILREPAEPVRVLRPEAPVELEQLIDEMLAKERVARLESAEAVSRRLAAIRLAIAEIPASDGFDSATVNAPRSRREAYSSATSHAELRVLSVVLVKAQPPLAEALSLATTEPLEEPDPAPDHERSAPSDVRPIAELQAAVAPHHGRVDPLLDGSLLVTLSPTATPKEQAIQAARCALALQRLLGDFPMAICTGQAAVQGRSAIGEVIERGSKMLAEGATARITVDGATAALIDGRFVIDRGALASFLSGERDAFFEHRMLLGKPSPCVGRERDLTILQGYIADCAEESAPRAVLVTAPAGQGKTRLREELLRRLRDSATALQVLVATADPQRTGSAFGTIGPALRGLAGIAPDTSVDRQRAKMCACFGRCLGPEAATRVSAFLGEIAGVPFDEDTLPALAAARQQPRLMADQMLAAWLDWLDAECGAGPVLVVLEDLQWADLSSVQFVEAALRAVRNKPLMVLGLARPEVHDRFPALWSEHGLHSIRLGALSRKACERVVQEALGDRVDADKRAWIAQRADGNPFFLEELIRAVSAGTNETALPVTILGMIHARLDALGDEAKHVVRAASVFGMEFTADGVRALLGAPESDHDVDRWLTILAEREVLYTKHRGGIEKSFAFRHGLLRDAAYATLPEGDRAMCHRLAGQWLEAAGETQAIVVAEHFERGQVLDRAAAGFRRAAAQAIEGNDLVSAIDYAERGIACGAQGELLGELDWVIMEGRHWRGQNTEAMAPGLEALRLLPYASSSWLRATGQLVCVAVCVGDASRAARVANDMLAAESAHPCDASGLLGLASGAYGMVSRHAELRMARPLLDAVIDTFEQATGRLAPQPLAQAWLDAVRGARKLIEDDWAQAVRFTEAAVDGFRQMGDLRGLTTALNNSGWYRQELGSLPRAEAALLEASEIAVRLGFGMVVDSVMDNRANVLLFEGRLSDAEVLYRSCIRTAEDQNDPRVGSHRYYLARVLLGQGKYGEGEAEGRASMGALGQASPWYPCAVAAVACGLLRFGRAEEALREAHAAARAIEANAVAPEGEAFVRLTLAEALHANGLVDEARRALRAARDRVVARAAAISDAELRGSFLAHVPDNARTLALAREWGD